MVPSEAPYPDVYTDTFSFFLRPLCKIIWINVHYFPNAPRTLTQNSGISLHFLLQKSGRLDAILEKIDGVKLPGFNMANDTENTTNSTTKNVSKTFIFLLIVFIRMHDISWHCSLSRAIFVHTFKFSS